MNDEENLDIDLDGGLSATNEQELDNNPVHEAVLFYWGERCPDHEDGCPACEAWEQYDNMQERLEKHEAAHKAELNKYIDKLVESELAEREMLADAKAHERLSSLLEDFTQEGYPK